MLCGVQRVRIWDASVGGDCGGLCREADIILWLCPPVSLGRAQPRVTTNGSAQCSAGVGGWRGKAPSSCGFAGSCWWRVSAADLPLSPTDIGGREEHGHCTTPPANPCSLVVSFFLGRKK